MIHRAQQCVCTCTFLKANSTFPRYVLSLCSASYEESMTLYSKQHRHRHMKSLLLAPISHRISDQKGSSYTRMHNTGTMSRAIAAAVYSLWHILNTQPICMLHTGPAHHRYELCCGDSNCHFASNRASSTSDSLLTLQVSLTNYL